MLHSHNSDVVTFSVRLTDMQIVRSDIVRDSHMIVRIRPVEVPTAREEVAVRGKQPITVTAGRSEYNVQDDSIIKFQGVDGHPVYVSRGLTTLEGDRIYGTRIEVLYQFDGHRNDLEAIDSQLLELFKRIDLQ
ncbi:hypothetical protein BK666_27975 [Pseudomonas frederiksbergensis]|uniref:Uncharacterized protein n=1 Tax=Pseudomonas frederiksbergensis TaxID=104087 RepID=A0A423JNI0_9PSED|nr:hypothetical protein [Pseudomonas frederiksbergensis]RON39222.1 hypothetical protein BK666_27975 [Pseudomonas frederiksbergensis]